MYRFVVGISGILIESTMGQYSAMGTAPSSGGGEACCGGEVGGAGAGGVGEEEDIGCGPTPGAPLTGSSTAGEARGGSGTSTEGSSVVVKLGSGD